MCIIAYKDNKKSELAPVDPTILYTQKQDGCHEYVSLRYHVDTRDGSPNNIGDDDEESENGRAIGDCEETFYKLDPCPLQQKVQQVLKSSDKDSI